MCYRSVYPRSFLLLCSEMGFSMLMSTGFPHCNQETPQPFQTDILKLQNCPIYIINNKVGNTDVITKIFLPLTNSQRTTLFKICASRMALYLPVTGNNVSKPHLGIFYEAGHVIFTGAFLVHCLSELVIQLNT
jgi:hypothetical protein